MKAIIVFLLGVSIGYLAARLLRKPARVPAKRPAFYTWTSGDGMVTVAWPDTWIAGGSVDGAGWGGG